MLLNFFATCNKIGAFTLGGGYAMIPIMEREFVDKNKWMDKQEFMDIMVVAQTTPGIFAIDMASHIGYKLKGVWGRHRGRHRYSLAINHRHPHHRYVLPAFQGQLLGG